MLFFKLFYNIIYQNHLKTKMSKEFICADCHRNIDECVCHTVIYGCMTGSALAFLLKTINLPCIESSYIDYKFKTPKQSIKMIYPVSNRFVSLDEKTELDLFEYNAFYYFRLIGNLLKCYDCNSTQKKVFQIILTDEEQYRAEKIMPSYSCMKNYSTSACFL